VNRGEDTHVPAAFVTEMKVGAFDKGERCVIARDLCDEGLGRLGEQVGSGGELDDFVGAKLSKERGAALERG